MDYELINDEDYRSLPTDPGLKFVAIEGICRRNLTKIISRHGEELYDSLVRTQYMAIVAAAASELGIDGIEFPQFADRPSEHIDNFVTEAAGVAARIRVRATMQAAADPFSVRLAAGTRARIEMQVRKLREMIALSSLPDDRKSALDRKLDELLQELAMPRFGFAKAMATLAFISTATAGATGLLADAPGAVTTIVRLIGADKEAEDREVLRLGAKPAQKALPAPKRESLPKPKPAPRQDEGRDLDDEIPF